ncbi:putative nicotinate-nucleotide adenylyltransferase [Marinibactrum halimedae]|uniref:Probable nicotinate-nucleotide adenylyltransferase n=2 Tax=Marinibactrum halimedae TaxID=1444977 RepID=A0AA37T8H2_9GAMM|nr:putative nicotinate-nucleotide adenylyltransferase [Marinibactrum halimedae]
MSGEDIQTLGSSTEDSMVGSNTPSLDSALMDAKPLAVALFGGTFDPIHVGHLRMALELRQALGVNEVRLVPCHQPPHRGLPLRTSQQRAEMLTLAVSECDGLSTDLRELDRDGPSYSIDTVIEVRQEVGAATPLMLAMGMDSFIHFPSWYRSEEFLQYTHLVVMTRPGYGLTSHLNTDLSSLLNKQMTQQEMQSCPCGGVLIVQQTPLPISATQIREALQTGSSVQYLVPDVVRQYIQQNQLYR